MSAKNGKDDQTPEQLMVLLRIVEEEYSWMTNFLTSWLPASKKEARFWAVKRVLAFQIKEMMEAQNISKTEMARRMQTSRAALERLLDPENHAVTLNTMDMADRSLGKRLQLLLL